MKRIFLFFVLLAFTALPYAQQQDAMLSAQETADLEKALKEDAFFAQIMQRIGDPVKQYEQFKLWTHRSDSAWKHDQANLRPLSDIGTTEKFEMIPLIDWFTSREGMKGEAGVSYLIRTDEATILFDTGLNPGNTDPSPLLRNMEELGINPDEIDIIVISHLHGDHVGGGQWAQKNTFSLSGRQLDLGGKKVYTPEPMTYPGLEPVCSKDPVKIARGVATIGVIHAPMFFTFVEEQSLAFHVKDRGIVIVSGCGHQTIEKIVLRTELLFDAPLYALLGGFHLPISESRNIGRIYRYLVTGRLPWDPLELENIEKSIDFLKEHGVSLAGISGHDSCDSSLAAFRNAFRQNYIDIVVGEKISLGR